jgi:transposase-like protein
MELLKRPESRGGCSPEFKRELVEKIVKTDKALGDLAEEMGIPREVMRKWTLMVERSKTAVPVFEELPVPAWRVRQLQREIEDLRRLVAKQAEALSMLEAQGLP